MKSCPVCSIPMDEVKNQEYSLMFARVVKESGLTKEN